MTIREEREVKAQGLLQDALRRKKCLRCGCLRHALEALDARKEELALGPLLGKARALFQQEDYACRGCAFCYPAEALNLLEPSPAERLPPPPHSSSQWPPLPGDYTVLDAAAGVAVSTLGDLALAGGLAEAKPRGLAIVGKTETENLGIERIIRNTIANPALRYLIVAGTDVPGHLPGASLLALAETGVDASGRIIGTQAKRAVLPNIGADEIEAFRRQITLIDLIGCSDTGVLGARIEQLAATKTSCSGPCTCTESRAYPTPLGTADHTPPPTSQPGEVRLDRAGYFLILPLFDRRLLRVEHYDYRNRLLHLLEGDDIRQIYLTIIRNGWISELTHAAYLGKELARARECLERGRTYVQDGA